MCAQESRKSRNSQKTTSLNDAVQPAGVKLHPELSAFFSSTLLRYIATVTTLCQYVQSLSWSRTFAYRWYRFHVGPFHPFHVLVVAVGLLAAVRGPRVLGRSLGLVLLPVTLPSAAMLHVARMHVALTKMLWRSMRDDKSGKKDENDTTYTTYTTYANESDGSDNARGEGEDGASVFTLALSCLLFMPVVLTLPTTLWYAMSVCGIGAMWEVVGRCVARVLVTNVLRAGPIEPIGVGGRGEGCSHSVVDNSGLGMSAVPVGCWVFGWWYGGNDGKTRVVGVR